MHSQAATFRARAAVIPVAIVAGGLFFVAIGRAVGAAEPEAIPVPDDQTVSAGKWRVARVEMNGKEVDRAFTDMFSVEYTPDGRWTVLFKRVRIAEGNSTVDETTMPKSFEMATLGSGPQGIAGRKYAGIYEMNGTTRRLCIVSADRSRPRAFTSTRRGGELLVTLERVR